MVESHYESLLNRTCSRWTETISSNALGEDVVTMSYCESGIKCRIQTIDATQLRELPGKFEDVKHTAYFLSGQSLSTDDEIHYKGDTYRVRDVYVDSEGYTKKALLGEK